MTTAPHLYVQCDIPAGLTLAQYRSTFALPRPWWRFYSRKDAS